LIEPVNSGIIEAMIQEVINQIVNLILNHIEALIIFISVGLIFYFIKILLIQRLDRLSKKTSSQLDDMVVEIVRELRWPTLVVIAYIIASTATNGWAFTMPIWLRILLIAIITYQVAKVSNVVFRYSKNRSGVGNSGIIDGFSSIIGLVIYGIGCLVILTSLGYNVTSIVAGLGVGGIAIAFAMQSILSDIFSSLSIYFDQPFKVGDFIVVGSNQGTVKRIGLKTTRLKSLSGEMIIVANKDLTNSTLKNYRGLKTRRITEHLTFTTQTPNNKLERLQVDLPASLDAIPGVSFIRFHFSSFGASGLEHVLVYEINADSFEQYTATKNIVNLILKRHFEKKKIDLAYPTQTVFVKK